MQKYSVFSLIKNAFSNHQNWEVAWKDPTPKSEYDVQDLMNLEWIYGET